MDIDQLNIEDIGRNLNVTCGTYCTYPVLGLGALLAYSVIHQNPVSRMGANFLYNTGIQDILDKSGSRILLTVSISYLC